MKRIPLVSATVALLLMAGGLARAQDDAEIRAAIRLYKEAFDRGDGSALTALWTADGDIVDDEGQVLNGRETVGRIAPATDDAARPLVQIRETSLRFLTADVVLEDGTVDVTPPGGAVPLKGWFAATWIRQADGWKLAGVRESRIASPRAGPQLADLEWMVGDWTVVEDQPNREPAAALQPSAPNDRPAIDVSVRWNATRTFLLRDMTISGRPPANTSGGESVAASGDGLPAMHITQRIGWDPLSRQIVSWVFGSDGSHGEATWTHDDNTWIARTMAVMPDGTQTAALNIYVYDGSDRCTWRSVPTHVGGEHAPHVAMTMIRKKAAVPSPQGRSAQ